MLERPLARIAITAAAAGPLPHDGAAADAAHDLLRGRPANFALRIRDGDVVETAGLASENAEAARLFIDAVSEHDAGDVIAVDAEFGVDAETAAPPTGPAESVAYSCLSRKCGS